jgi:hypothetical protein
VTLVQRRLANASEARPAFSPASCPAIAVAWLFVVFPTTHFLLDPGVFDQLAKTLHGILNSLPIPKTQLDHQSLL